MVEGSCPEHQLPGSVKRKLRIFLERIIRITGGRIRNSEERNLRKKENSEKRSLRKGESSKEKSHLNAESPNVHLIEI